MSTYTLIPTERRLALIVDAEDYADFIELADSVGLPLKTLIMRTMRSLVAQHKEKNTD